MGACNFSNLVVIKGDARDAYREANEEMRDYNGHQEGYSGDIQTTEGFYDMTHLAPKYGTKAFDKWEDKQLDGDRIEKWGACGCVEIKSPAMLKRLKESNGYKGKKGVRAFYFFGWGAC